MDFRTIGGGGDPQSFSDTFVRADTASGLGNNWIGSLFPPNANNLFAKGRILSNKAHSFRNAGAGAGTSLIYYPRSVCQSLFGKNQFAKITITQVTNGAGVDTGVVCASIPDPFDGTATGYSLLVFNSGAVQKWTLGPYQITSASTFPDLLAGYGANFVSNQTFTAGDTLELDVAFGAASNTLTVKQNGVTTNTVTDANAARPTTGLPGMLFYIDNGANTDVSLFACGPV